MKHGALSLFGLLMLLSFIRPTASAGADFPLTITDARGTALHFLEKPHKVVSLVPYVTEMLLEFGQAPVLVALTGQDLILNSGLRKTNLGSYFNPDISAIEQCRPDLIIAAPSHAAMTRHFRNAGINVMVMEVQKVSDAFRQMMDLGRLFNCESKAAAIIKHNQEQLAVVKAKIDRIPMEKRKRVARVMSGNTITCPGDDSFQNEIITAAGGIVPRWGKSGFAVPVELGAWQKFNPQFVYGCHQDSKAVKALLNRDGWKDVAAMQNRAVTMFPFDLTCQVSTRVGAFVQWLSAVLYLETFADPEKALSDNTVLSEEFLPVDFEYVQQARRVAHRVNDAEFKSLVVRFKRPMTVLSTLEGPRTNIKGVGNTYVPIHASLGHMAYGITQVQEAIAVNLGFDVTEYTGLMTGAHMDHLSIQNQTHKNLKVTALVTAGVRGNALRLSKDTGGYMAHGTINIIVLSNRQLQPSAMAGAVIVITEAKTAALQDLDIRSTYSPWQHGATGTGTDTVIVVQGEGPKIQYTGGHTKIGELIAKAVHAGVTQAVLKQNSIMADRDLFQRLAERKCRVEDIAALVAGNPDNHAIIKQLYQILADPYYASFLESALAVSDAYGKGQIKHLDAFDAQCAEIAIRLRGSAESVPATLSDSQMPVVMVKAFGALLSGIPEGDLKK